MKKLEPKRWKKTKKKKLKEKDFYLKITKGEKTSYSTKVGEEIKKGILRIPEELAIEIMKNMDVESLNELEFTPKVIGKNKFMLKMRKKSAYIV